MLENYAARVRFVRSLTKLSREAFEEIHKINRNTLKSWELGVNTLTEKSAKVLSDAINHAGFSCSPQWLIFGHGEEPRPISQADDEALLEEITQKTRVIYEADYFKKNNPNSIVSMITDTSMFPEFKPSDYVGGINLDLLQHLPKLIGSSCIINIKNNLVVVRKILLSHNEDILLCPVNTDYNADIIKKEDILTIANIVWHRTTFI